jgi:hypothetical protein
MEVDHIDGDGLNNTRSNLRVVTKTQNMQNRRINKNNTSGHKGVAWDKESQKWMAYISSHGVRRNLGRFETPEQAAAAYLKGSLELHGEFGRTQ